ncbi:MAG: PadR family transcriptional regulator [Acidobacteria bacterium]|nr:PadR family transcriptional regulator [Acidobacteriota bacterium]
MPAPNDKDRGDLLRGALEMLILRTLEHQAMHGYAITESILEASQEILDIDEGSMYPALYRMQKRGWIEAEWGRSENNRRAKFYAMTDEGRRRLEAASERWNRFSEGVERVMEPT